MFLTVTTLYQYTSSIVPSPHIPTLGRFENASLRPVKIGDKDIEKGERLIKSS